MAQDTHNVDFNRASELLNVIDKSVAHSGKLGHLANAAMTELLAMDKNLEEHATKKNRERAEAEKARQAKLQAEIDKKAQENMKIIEQEKQEEEKNRIAVEARARATQEIPTQEVELVRRPPTTGAIGAPKAKATRVMTPEEEEAADKNDGALPEGYTQTDTTSPRVIPRRDITNEKETSDV